MSNEVAQKMNDRLHCFLTANFSEETQRQISVHVSKTDLSKIFDIRVRANSREILQAIDTEAKAYAKEIDDGIILNFC